MEILTVNMILEKNLIYTKYQGGGIALYWGSGYSPARPSPVDAYACIAFKAGPIGVPGSETTFAIRRR